MRYTEKVSDVTLAAVKRRAEIKAQIEELNKQMNADKIARADYLAQVKGLQDESRDIYSNTYNELDTIKADYTEKVKRLFVPKGEDMHPDMQLLSNKYITLDSDSFTALVNKHKDNMTMTQMLFNYSNDHPGLYADRIPGRDVKIEDFNAYVDTATSVVRLGGDSLQRAFFETGKYTPATCTEEI